MPTSFRGAPALLVRRGGERLLFDCGEGTQRQLLDVRRRPRRPPRDLPHALPRRSLPRPAGDAEDVRSARSRGADHDLRADGPRARSSATCAASSASSPTSTRSSSFGPATACRATATSSTSFPSSTDGTRSATRCSRTTGRDGSTCRPRTRLGVPAGPERGALQRGEPVTLADGRVVTPDEVLGPPRRGRKVSITGDTAPSSDVVEAVRNADVLVHEATFLEDEQERARETLHSTALDAAACAREADVGTARARPSLQPLPRARRGPRGPHGLPGDSRPEGLRYDRGRIRGARRAPARQGWRRTPAAASGREEAVPVGRRVEHERDGASRPGGRRHRGRGDPGDPAARRHRVQARDRRRAPSDLDRGRSAEGARARVGSSSRRSTPSRR